MSCAVCCVPCVCLTVPLVARAIPGDSIFDQVILPGRLNDLIAAWNLSTKLGLEVVGKYCRRAHVGNAAGLGDGPRRCACGNRFVEADAARSSDLKTPTTRRVCARLAEWKQFCCWCYRWWWPWWCECCCSECWCWCWSERWCRCWC